MKAKHWQKASPLTAILRVADTGNVHFPVAVNAKLTNIFGGQVAKSQFSLIVLPGYIRALPISFTPKQGIGIYHISGTANFLGGLHGFNSGYILLASVKWLAALIFAGVVLVILAIRVLWNRIRRKR